ncbi:transposase [Massilia sp. METH4]|uniref:REP-associated tyrosine transposase n=1 Tax=Massilia sp. METH4 TaxID=3123041 RepID=UPI0030CD4A23
MSRQKRIQFPGAIYHVTSRGNRRATIFVDDRDREIMMKLYGDTAARFNLVVYALCLMPNHFHFLLETPDANISRAMQYLKGNYAQKFNWRHGLTGHVFQGRFFTELVDHQEQLLELLRYVVLNPIRARLVRHADDWHWSTHLHTSGKLQKPAWLNSDWVLDQFPGSTRQDRIRAYREFVDAGDKQRPPSRYGGKRYVSIDAAYMEIPLLEQLERQHACRDAAVVAAWACRGYTRDQIARHFNLSTRTVSRIIAAASSNR